MRFLAKLVARRRIMASGWFDPDFYLAHYPDVAAAGCDPLAHFLANGGREARSPSRRFDGPRYIHDNPDAAAADNLLLDWLREGRKGRRVPPEPLGSTRPLSPPSLPPSRVRQRDIARVRRSGLFDTAHLASAHPGIGGDMVAHYLATGWRENLSIGPGFDGHYVAVAHLKQRNDLPGARNPLLHLLDHPGLPARPDGAITLTPGAMPPAGLRVAIHIHLHHSDLIEVILPYLDDAADFDLLISTGSDADARFIAAMLAQHGRSAVIRVMPNRGRDLAPFLIGFADVMGGYDLVCHLHSKRSPHTDFGEDWLAWILRCLFGEAWIMPAILAHMAADPACAMLFPDNFPPIKRYADWGGNEARLLALLEAWGHPLPRLPDFPNFAAGSMAWFRADFIADIASNLSLDDFEVEQGQQEGTLAHVLERALPLAAQARGLRVCRYYLDRIPAPRTAPRRHHPGSPHDATGRRWRRDTPAIARNPVLPLAPLSRRFDPARLIIHWIIPDFGIGAGGHMTIFRMVEYLERFGHHQTIWIQNARNHAGPAAARAAITAHYRPLGPNTHVRFLPDDVRQLSGDIIIATDCWTAFPVASVTNAKARCYFIQDYEPWFHPMGENYLIAQATYGFGFAALCAGPWLLDKAHAHGMWARRWDLAVDRGPYHPGDTARPPQPPTRIVFYSRSNTPRRAVPLGLAAFAELARRRRDFVVDMFGEAPSRRRFAFPNRQCGILRPAELGDLYRAADIGVSFSTTNYSLVPLEMMASGLPVVEVDSESARAAFPAGSVSFAAPTPHAVADAIERLMDDAAARAAQRAAGFAFAEGLDWERSARTIESALIERLMDSGFQPVDPASLAAPAILSRRRASVIIPTWNGGALFHDVLARVAAQETDFDYDVLVIDSSSTDGTAELARGFGGRVRCQSIDQRDFQHGRTRNQAIAATDGALVAVLTQDALPQDAHWLSRLLAPFAAEPRVAGVIGRHRAYPAHNRLMARDLDLMFDRMRDLGPLFGLDRGLPGFIRPGSIDWRLAMHFYSDNNSAMRRSVWEHLPYPEIDWGEDQVWCWEMLKLGLWKAYADDAVVFHSHDLAPADQLRTAAHEGEMFARHFGYALSTGPLGPSALGRLRRQAEDTARSAGIPLADVDAYAAMLAASAEGRALGWRAAHWRPRPAGPPHSAS